MSHDISEVLEENLNTAQRAAATDDSSEVICLACAGSGKSRTLAYRIARLIADGNDPEEIVAFTFSRKAAESIKRRVSQALEATGFDPTMVGAMFIGTIHSYSLEILREIDAAYQQFDPLDGNRLKLYLISRYPDLELYKLRNREDAGYFETIREVASAWRIFNDERLSLEEIAQEDRQLAEVLNELRNNLLEDQYLDFSAMVRLTVEAFQNGRQGANEVGDNIRHTLVDEYQDVVPVEEALTSTPESCVTGVLPDLQFRQGQ
jgi:DNA helicase-2/ATP-dependent DNA helicase PcrA